MSGSFPRIVPCPVAACAQQRTAFKEFQEKERKTRAKKERKEGREALAEARVGEGGWPLKLLACLRVFMCSCVDRTRWTLGSQSLTQKVAHEGLCVWLSEAVYGSEGVKQQVLLHERRNLKIGDPLQEKGSIGAQQLSHTQTTLVLQGDRCQRLPFQLSSLALIQKGAAFDGRQAAAFCCLQQQIKRCSVCVHSMHALEDADRILHLRLSRRSKRLAFQRRELMKGVCRQTFRTTRAP